MGLVPIWLKARVYTPGRMANIAALRQISAEITEDQRYRMPPRAPGARQPLCAALYGLLTHALRAQYTGDGAGDRG